MEKRAISRDENEQMSIEQNNIDDQNKLEILGSDLGY